MASGAHYEYLRNAVMTASPAQLQLMLYDGAIRFARQGREAIERGDVEASYNLLTRAQRIVLELQNGLNYDVDRELCERMAALYTFIYTRLVDANVKKDVKAVDDALRILEHQRETWVMLMEKLGLRPKEEAPAEPPTSPVEGSLCVEG